MRKCKCSLMQNVQPSISRSRIDLLKKANEAIEGNENFKFTYAHMHGNLKFIQNNPLDAKYVKPFKNKDNIISITAYSKEDEL